jgi:hypothetical protein
MPQPSRTSQFADLAKITGQIAGDRFDAATKTAELRGARKIWYWAGAASCHGIAARGLDTAESKIAPIVSAVISCDVVEIVAMTDQAFACVIEAPEWTP